MNRIVLALMLGAGLAAADDWPQWLGPERDGVWREAGVRKDLPKDGAKVLWRAPVSWGYAGPAVADGKVFVPDFLVVDGEFDGRSQGGRPLQGSERILCFDAQSGKRLWTHQYNVTYGISYPGGPRVTPTVHEGKVYFQGAMGHFSCLDAATGKPIWNRDITADYGCEPPRWGYSGHPLVHGDLVYVLAGGEGSVLLALDKMTGKEKWKALSAEEAGYCPPRVIRHAGVEQLLFWYPAGVVGLNPATGEKYWEVALEPKFAISRMAPRVLGNRMFVAGPGAGAMFELSGEKPGAKLLWEGARNNSVYPLNAAPHLKDGVIYGVDGEESALMAVSMEDGERLWMNQSATLAPDAPDRSRHGTAFLVHHEPNGQFWLFGEMGDLVLAELSKDGYREVGRQHLIAPTNSAWGRKVVWSQPAFAMRSVFARNDREIIRVDLAE